MTNAIQPPRILTAQAANNELGLETGAGFRDYLDFNIEAEKLGYYVDKIPNNFKGARAVNDPVMSKEVTEHDSIGFPKVEYSEIQIARRFGSSNFYEAGEYLYKTGDQPIDCYIIVSGEVQILDLTGDEPRIMVEYGDGAFTGEIAVLTQRPAIASCRAKTRCEAIRLTGEEMRGLMVCCPSLQEKWIPALLRRRELIMDAGFQGLRVFGPPKCNATLLIREFLQRNSVIHRWLNTLEPEVNKLVHTFSPDPLEFPVVVCARQILLQNPTLPQVAQHTGIQRTIPDGVFDTVIIGAGPAGLGAAVYAASEGLRTVVLDTIGPGGQAGSSARIENYAGFPSGLSGNDLALRTYVQALKFGAHFSAPHTIDSVRCAEQGLHEVHTSEGLVVKTKTVIIATGVSYRNLDVDGLKRLRGNGVYYAATQVEAAWCEDRPVHIIGAGNSAGQASMYLSKFTDQVNLIVRGGDIRKTMSSYLSERVETNPRVKIRLRHELRMVEGTHTVERVHLENTTTGEKTIEESNGLFIFIGATPCSNFLGHDVLKDKRGFVMTGNQVVGAGNWPLSDRQPQLLETSCPGIFVAGDCRSETTKRVAFAIGDGALAVTCVHNVLGT